MRRVSSWTRHESYSGTGVMLTAVGVWDRRLERPFYCQPEVHLFSRSLLRPEGVPFLDVLGAESDSLRPKTLGPVYLPSRVDDLKTLV